MTNPTFDAGTHILSGYGLGTLRYDLDGAGDSFVLLDYSLAGRGSGASDMYVLIPKFTGKPGETLSLGGIWLPGFGKLPAPQTDLVH